MPRNPIRIPVRSLILLSLCTLVILAAGATPASSGNGVTSDPTIAAMMAQVQTATLITYVNQLSGEVPATVGGMPYTFITRDTESGVPIQRATQFAYEFLQAHGLAASYENWTGCGISSRNVIGEKVGTQRPAEIVLATAHLDSINESGGPLAPGADDNASASAAVMAMAEIMASRQFQRTVRFVLFTGEEQGLCGSWAYARAAATEHENIVAVYNMDMLAWDSNAQPIVRLHTRTTRNAGYAADLAIANTFANIVSQYGLSGALSPLVTPDGEDASDHSSFWDNGYAAILAIEDDYDDFNPYYHSANDKVSAYNQSYYTNFVKASVGTVAQLAGTTLTFRVYLPMAIR
jgi:Zn-dependent M28 family amino/carboxypeptidase